MKHAVKYIIGGSMVLVGIIMVMVACTLGGWQMLREWPGISFSGFGVFYKTVNYASTVESENVMNIKKLEIDVTCAEFTLTSDDVEEIDIKAENAKEHCFSYDINGDTLKIKYDLGFTFLCFNWSSARINVVIPENIKFESVIIKNGVGEMRITGLETEYLQIDSGAGAAAFSNIKADRMDVSTGVGEVKITDTITNNIKLDSGVGKMTYEGEIHGDVDIDSGVGEVVIDIKGDKDDYRFNVDKGIGDVILNGSSCSGNFGNGKYSVKIDSGVGAVRITID